MDKPKASLTFSQRWFNKNRVGYFFILPSCIIILVFVLLPLAVSFILSLTNLDIFLGMPAFTGLDNLKRSFLDERFWNAMKNTLKFVALSVPIQMLLSLLLAYWLSKPTVFNKLCRSVFYVPVLCSFTATGILFGLIMNSTVGYVPYVISWFTGEATALLSDVRFAMPIIILLSVWKTFGRTLIILVSGINDIPVTLYEAASMDGATQSQQFFRITFPNLLPTINFTLLTSLISAFQVFDAVYVTTGGGPLNTTETIVQYIYYRGFSMPYELGYASTMAVQLFLVIAVLVLVFKGLLERRIKQIY